MGIAFLGLVGVWALIQSDAVGAGDVRWLLPIPWVLAGLAGLLAIGLSGSKRWTTRQTGWVPATPRHDDTTTDMPPPTPRSWRPNPTTRRTDEHHHHHKRLIRRSDDRMIAGVCSGVADYLGIDPTLVRLLDGRRRDLQRRRHRRRLHRGVDLDAGGVKPPGLERRVRLIGEEPVHPCVEERLRLLDRVTGVGRALAASVAGRQEGVLVAHRPHVHLQTRGVGVGHQATTGRRWCRCRGAAAAPGPWRRRPRRPSGDAAQAGRGHQVDPAGGLDQLDQRQSGA